MSGQIGRKIVQCRECGGIAPGRTGPNGAIRIPDDISLGGCETHDFVVLDEELEGENDGSAMLDTIFDLLTAKHRRYALYYLDTTDQPVSLEALSKQVARWEAEGPPDTIPSDTYDRIEVALTHRHLPKLDSVEFIEYDRDARCISLRGASPAFEGILTIAKLVEKPGEDS